MGDYLSSLSASLEMRGIDKTRFCNLNDPTERRILKEYGAVFIADLIPEPPAPGQSPTQRVKLPSRFMFDNEKETNDFQSSVELSSETIGGTRVFLQKRAMNALLNAVAETKADKNHHLTITPRGSENEASRRSYAETVRLWNQRITAGIQHWEAKANKKGKKLTKAEGQTLAALSGLAQVKEVVRLEENGFFFSTYQDKTIFASVAAPGSSQHCFMLALDVKEFADQSVRKIMAKHGWFRTAYTDDPHFTYLGLKEQQLSSLGIAPKEAFWVPAI